VQRLSSPRGHLLHGQEVWNAVAQWASHLCNGRRGASVPDTGTFGAPVVRAAGPAGSSRRRCRTRG